MALLLDEDYEQLRVQGMGWEEFPDKRFLFLKNFPLPSNVYTVASADILVIIPTDYPEGGNDMFWTSPRLIRQDGGNIPQTSPSGAGENHIVNGVEFHRWSRHWFQDMPSAWRPGLDNLDTIMRRITWALKKSPLT